MFVVITTITKIVIVVLMIITVPICYTIMVSEACAGMVNAIAFVIVPRTSNSIQPRPPARNL